MRNYIVALGFDDALGEMSMAAALEDHPQIKDFMSKNAAVQIAANVFIMETDDSAEQLLGHLTAFVDRGEDVFVGHMGGEWHAVSSHDKLNLIAHYLGHLPNQEIV